MELYYFLRKKTFFGTKLKKGSSFISFFQLLRDRKNYFVKSLFPFSLRGEWGDPKNIRTIWERGISSKYLSEGDFLSSLFYKDKKVEYGLIAFCHLRIEEPLFFHESKIKWFSINEERLLSFSQGRHWLSNIFHPGNTAFFLGKENRIRNFPYPFYLVGLSVSDRNRLWLGLSGYKEKGEIEFFENSIKRSSLFSLSLTSYQEEGRDLLFPSKLFVEEEGQWIFEEKKKTKKILGTSVDNLLRKFFRDDIFEVDLKGIRRDEKKLSSIDGKRYFSYFPFSLYSAEYLFQLQEEFFLNKFKLKERSFFFFEKIKMEDRRINWSEEKRMERSSLWYEENSYYNPRGSSIFLNSLQLMKTYRRHEEGKGNYD